MADALIKAAGGGRIEYVDFPEVLRGKYQSFTEADMEWTGRLGFPGGFTPLTAAVAEYYRCLEENNGYLR